jgi:hypothetical protein
MWSRKTEGQVFSYAQRRVGKGGRGVASLAGLYLRLWPRGPSAQLLKQQAKTDGVGKACHRACRRPHPLGAQGQRIMPSAVPGAFAPLSGTSALPQHRVYILFHRCVIYLTKSAMIYFQYELT